MNGVKPLVAFVLFLALILQIVSLSTHYWSRATFHTSDEHKHKTIKGSIGLWKMCETTEITDEESAATTSTRKCNDLLSQYVTDRLKLARALIIISILAALPSTLVVMLTCQRRAPNFVVVTVVISLLQAVLQAVGVGAAVWWLDMFSNLHPSYSWSLHLGATVSLIYLAASVLSCVAYSFESRTPYPAVYRDDAEGTSYTPMLEHEDK